MLHLWSYLIGIATVVAIEVVAAVILWWRGVRWTPR